MKNTYHVQCELKKGKSQQVSWIPEKVAIKGKFIKLKQYRHEEWDKDWEVISTGIKKLKKKIIER